MGRWTGEDDRCGLFVLRLYVDAGVEADQMKCPICPARGFPNRAMVQQHMEDVHMGLEQMTLIQTLADYL